MALPTSVEELRPGDHACLTFSDAQEHLDIVAAFVDDGLRHHQRVMCFTQASTPEALSAEMLDRGLAVTGPLRTGQLSVHSSDESWLHDGRFTAQRMIDTWARHIDAADRDGYAGLRVSADMCWATRPVTGVEQLVVFESEVNRLFADARLTAICQYDRHVFDPVTLAAAAAAHGRAVAAATYHEDPVLRVCRQYSPPGVRVAGELDYTRADVFGQALAEALRLTRNVHVNLRALSFIDAAAAGVLVQAAVGLRDGRRLIVECAGLVEKVLRLVGADELAPLRLRVVDAQP